MEVKQVSRQTLKRLPVYLNYLKSISGQPNISAAAIADALKMGDVQVRKDLAQISSGGRPKTGYVTSSLIKDIEAFLGCRDTNAAVLVGAGNMGRAILSYEGFSGYGLQILAAFDTDPEKIDTKIGSTPVFDAARLTNLLCRMNIKIGIIAVPPQAAQEVCDKLTQNGVKAIWNFAPVHLCVPEDVLAENEDMAYSLSILSQRLSESMSK